jgi:hypothetical protein
MMPSRGYRDRPPGAKRTGRLQNREEAEAAALRENLRKRKAQSRARDPQNPGANPQNSELPAPDMGPLSKDPPNPESPAIAPDRTKP